MDDDNEYRDEPQNPVFHGPEQRAAVVARGRGFGRPFASGHSGNPLGRPPGVRNKATQLAQSLLDERTAEIADRAIALAVEGDPVALKLCFDRILPRRRDHAIAIDLPTVDSVASCTEAITKVIASAADGEVTLHEAQRLVGLIESQRRGALFDEFARRVTGIEEAIARRDAAG